MFSLLAASVSENDEEITTIAQTIPAEDERIEVV